MAEITTFDLNSGVNENAFEVRDTEIEKDFASQQNGFLKRTFYRTVLSFQSSNKPLYT